MMPPDTPSFTEVELAPLPWTVMVPTRRVDETDWLEGVRTLMLAAFPLYNASLNALRLNQIPRAIELAGQALHIMPYAPNLLEYAAALTIQHGDFVLAARILQTATHLGIDDLAQPHAEALAHRAAQWNEALAHPETLLTRYAKPHSAPSYRDLRYLQHLNPTPRPPGLAPHLADYGLPPLPATPSPAASVTPLPASVQQAPRWSLVAASVVVVAVLSGLAGYFASPRTAPQPVPAPPALVEMPPPDSPPQPANTEIREVLEKLANGDAGAALADMQRLRDGQEQQTLDALEQIAVSRLTADAEPLWQRRKYAELLHVLRPLVRVPNRSHPEILYYLGIAAEKAGEDTLAFDAFAQFLAHDAATAFPHFRAQAAYLAALLAPPGEAKPFAQIIAAEYPYYHNSTIRHMLRDEY